MCLKEVPIRIIIFAEGNFSLKTTAVAVEGAAVVLLFLL